MENVVLSKTIDDMVKKARKALDEYMKLDQKSVDRIVEKMARAAMESHVKLAELALNETGRGILEDKIIKNMFSAEYVWDYIRHEKTVGIVDKNDSKEYIEIADPLGVIAGITPVTNPTSTTVFKSLICAKTRNPIIFGFHPGASKCCTEAAKILLKAAEEAGAPKNSIQWIEHPSIEATSMLINHSGVDVVLATGGSSLVKAAYSTGKPALGVGPGNVPCYIEKTAKLSRACTDLILSKTFDNGMICASEQSVIVDEEISKDFEREVIDFGCVFLNDMEVEKLSQFMFEQGRLNSNVVGKSACEIASMAKISVPDNTKILIAKLSGVGDMFPLSAEKLSPVLAYYVSKDSKEAFEICQKVLKFNGQGHTAAIHSENEDLISKFSLIMNASRIVVNSPSSHAAIGGIYNENVPSLTLGCGSHGKNSTSLNVSCEQLINRKKILMRRNNMQWFKVPPKIYFEKNSINYLMELEGIRRVFIVTDRTMINLGNLEKVTENLNKRKEKCIFEIFSDVSPNPDTKTVFKGLEAMANFKPDCIIAFGGGSVIDAAKAMWLFLGQKNLRFEDLRLKFMDIRKRVYKFSDSHRSVKFIAIPTTSGTGSEVTSFAVITDKSSDKEIKYPLADYSLTPDIAIVDPQFVMSLPKLATADTGMDVLTHAIEAYVSTMANDYTDGLCIQAVKMVFEYLKRAFENGDKDKLAREKMHNAATIAGMAFTNSFLGLNHSMAHKLGGEFNVSHGRANAILLPYVIEYNSSLPQKFAAFPKYENFIADKKYSYLANVIGVKGRNAQESVKNFINAILSLNDFLGIPQNFKETGISEDDFLSKVDVLAHLAHEDQCTGTNPRYPLVGEIKEIYIKSYYGR